MASILMRTAESSSGSVLKVIRHLLFKRDGRWGNLDKGWRQNLFIGIEWRKNLIIDWGRRENLNNYGQGIEGEFEYEQG